MKNSSTLSLVFAAGAAGVALFKFASTSFSAAVPVEAVGAIAVSAAVIALAIFDYSRRPQPLTVRAQLLRPALPAAVVPGPGRTPAKAHCDERAAA